MTDQPSQQLNKRAEGTVIISYLVPLMWLKKLSLPGADPGFGIREGVSRRGVWGPLKVPQRIQDRALVGGQGGETPPPKLWGFEELHTFI